MSKKNFTDEQWLLFTDEFKKLLRFIESTLTYEHPILSINKHYFLLGIFQFKDCLAYKIIDALISSTSFQLVYEAYYRLVVNHQLTIVKPNRSITYDEQFQKMIKDGITEMNNLNDNKLSSIHIVMALTNPDNGFINTQKMLKSAGLSYRLLKNRIQSLKNDLTDDIKDENLNVEKLTKSSKKTKPKYSEFEYSIGDIVSPYNKNIFTFCKNLNLKAKEGKINPVIGREKEIERIAKVFNRRNRNNVMLIGEKGSGKTAICESLAWYIVNNECPYTLNNKVILKLDIPSIIAGTTYRGMFEERVRDIFTELKKNPNYILFIDDLHSFSPKSDHDTSTDIIPYLKEAINDNDIKVIITCTSKGFHKKFESDHSLVNKFQRININQLTQSEIKNIIMQAKGYYEDFHSVHFSESIIDLSIFLCSKYIQDREMPDSVLDVLDEIGASVSQKYKEPVNISKLKKELKVLENKRKEYISQDLFDEIDLISEEESKKKKEIIKLEKKIKYETVLVTDEMVKMVISEKTGIPVHRLTQENKSVLVNLEKRLKEKVIGQDDAIDTICKVIKRKTIGLNSNKSIVFLCHGTTGSGKTFLAKKLAEELFGSEESMVRFDMSEYSDKTGINKLIGSNPGYVGYEDGGLLTESIKNKKYCILLLDEFEKADKEIYNIFLQVFDEGFLTDNTGQKVDFRNVIILLTSNVGAKEALVNNKTIGFTRTKDDDIEKSNSILNKELKNHFSPEFLNRLDAIIHFNTLKENDLKHIIKLEIDKSMKQFVDIGYNVSYCENIIDFIYDKVKKESEYGARPILRAIQNEVETPIVDFILDNEDINKKDIQVSFENKLLVTF